MKYIYLSKKTVYILIGCFITSIFLLSFISLRTISTSSTPVSMQDTVNGLFDSPQKNAFLTFDDGPTIKQTNKILDILKEENVRASFFVIGRNVKEHPEIVKRAYTEGHYIANHGYSHKNYKLYQSTESFFNEIQDTDKEIAKALELDEYCSHFFRFPNGFMSPSYKGEKKKMLNVLKDMNYVYVDWNCLNKDSETKCSDYQLMQNLKNSINTDGTLIILMHDTGDVNITSNVLKDSILFLKDQGYTFKNFYDIL